MCLTLPKVLIVFAGIEKVIPKFRDLEIMLQLLPRSATGERMNPYNSVWSGVYSDDGPEELHIILLDNGRSAILHDDAAQQTLKCIRCGACQNACPVYQQTGGHAYGSVYAGPIGAILTPQLYNLEQHSSLPFASSLCGACYEVCPVKINIPEILIHLRGRVVRREQQALLGRTGVWNVSMQIAGKILAKGWRLHTAQVLGRILQIPFVKKSGFIESLPFLLAGWTQTRDLAPLPQQSFREWWVKRQEMQRKPENKGILQ